jgi:hypothetical protein
MLSPTSFRVLALVFWCMTITWFYLSNIKWILWSRGTGHWYQPQGRTANISPMSCTSINAFAQAWCHRTLWQVEQNCLIMYGWATLTIETGDSWSASRSSFKMAFQGGSGAFLLGPHSALQLLGFYCALEFSFSRNGSKAWAPHGDYLVSSIVILKTTSWGLGVGWELGPKVIVVPQMSSTVNALNWSTLLLLLLHIIS